MNIKKLCREVEANLYNYRDMLEYVNSCDSLPKSGADSQRVAPGGIVSDPVPNDAIRRAESKAGRWVRLIDDAMAALPRDKHRMIEAVYIRRHKKPQHNEHMRIIYDICGELNISTSTFYKWREEILNGIGMDAVYRGLTRE